MMDIGQCKEQFSIAHARAVASAAGFSCSRPEVDDDSVDLMICGRSSSGTLLRPRLEVQLKCTSNRSYLKGKHLNFPLSKKNYDDLQGTNLIVPRILVVMLVPDDINTWLHQTHDELRMLHCSYWVSLRSSPPSTNKTTITVRVPRANMFTVAQLRDMMQNISNGGAP
jgi:hypothetical protein